MPVRTLLDTADFEDLMPASDAPRLNESRLVRAMQCDRRLWLAVNRPDLLVINAVTQAIFNSGNRVGKGARLMAVHEWEQAELIDVKETRGWQGGWQQCQERLQKAQRSGTRAVLFEAPFIGLDFAVIADIVVHQPDGEIWLIEVKSSTRLEDKPYIDDVTIQAEAMVRSGLRPDRVFVRLIDPSCVYPGGEDDRELFRDEDVTEGVRERLLTFYRFVARSRAVEAIGNPHVVPRIGRSRGISADRRGRSQVQIAASNLRDRAIDLATLPIPPTATPLDTLFPIAMNRSNSTCLSTRRWLQRPGSHSRPTCTTSANSPSEPACSRATLDSKPTSICIRPSTMNVAGGSATGMQLIPR
jgi:hypothetical protein